MRAVHLPFLAAFLAGSVLADETRVAAPVGNVGGETLSAPGADTGAPRIDSVADPGIDANAIGTDALTAPAPDAGLAGDAVAGQGLNAGITGVDTPDRVGVFESGEPFDGTIYPGAAIPGVVDDDGLAGDAPAVVGADGPLLIVPDARDQGVPADDEGAATLDANLESAPGLGEGAGGDVQPRRIQVD